MKKSPLRPAKVMRRETIEKGLASGKSGCVGPCWTRQVRGTEESRVFPAFHLEPLGVQHVPERTSLKR